MATTRRKAKTTVGFSPKAMLAFILPALGTLVLALINVILGPDIDPSLKVAIVGFVNACLAFAGAYVGKPGTVTVND